jgi:hypothetical protein
MFNTELSMFSFMRQMVFTVPKMLRLFFRFRRKLLDDLCLSGVSPLMRTQTKFPTGMARLKPTRSGWTISMQ